MCDFLHPHPGDLGLASGVLSDIVRTQCGTTIRVPPSLQKNTHTPHPAPFSLNSNSAFRNACLWCLSVLADRHYLSMARDRSCSQRIGQIRDLGRRDMAIIGNRISHAEETVGTTDCREIDETCVRVHGTVMQELAAADRNENVKRL